MTKPHERAARRMGHDDLADQLASLPGSEWASLLLEVERQRAEARPPSEVLAQHRRDPYVRPSDVDQRALHAADGRFLAVTPPSFEAVELSPVVPLATVSSVAKAHQNKVCTAQRSLEVVADPTNALALIAAERRRAGAEVVRLHTNTRALRMQRFAGASSWQHFRIAAWVTAGRDAGGHRFAAECLAEHLSIHLAAVDLFRDAGAPLGTVRRTLCIEPSQAGWVRPLLDLPVLRGAREGELPEGGYYRGLRFVLDVEVDGGWMNIADGGLVDWLQALCASRRERLFISAVGTERLALLTG